MTRHVPISEFKDHASELVAAAERGEEIAITRHGKVAARLVAPARITPEQRERARQAFVEFARIRAEQRALGMTSTVEEMSEWKNEGRR
jgi:prevent-host-death family protein